MKIALTAWEDRISPVFDSARTLLIAEIKNAEIIKKRYQSFNPEMTTRLSKALNNLNVEVLICGAISEIPSNIIETSGIKLIPFIGGKIEEVLESYVKGIKIVPSFLMPGCSRQQVQERKRHRGCPNRQLEVKIMPKKNGTGPQGKGSGTGKGRGGCKAGKGRKMQGQGSGRRNGQGKKQNRTDQD